MRLKAGGPTALHDYTRGENMFVLLVPAIQLDMFLKYGRHKLFIDRVFTTEAGLGDAVQEVEPTRFEMLHPEADDDGADDDILEGRDPQGKRYPIAFVC